MFIQIGGDQNSLIHTYQVLLCNPGRISPFPYKLIEALHWTGKEFSKNIKDIIELMQLGIKIFAITRDNERAQLNGLDPSSPNSFL